MLAIIITFIISIGWVVGGLEVGSVGVAFHSPVTRPPQNKKKTTQKEQQQKQQQHNNNKQTQNNSNQQQVRKQTNEDNTKSRQKGHMIYANDPWLESQVNSNLSTTETYGSNREHLQWLSDETIAAINNPRETETNTV